MLDFLNLPPIPPGAFDLATRKDQICLKTSTPKNTLLPEDLHYKARFSTRSSAADSGGVSH